MRRNHLGQSCRLCPTTFQLLQLFRLSKTPKTHVTLNVDQTKVLQKLAKQRNPRNSLKLSAYSSHSSSDSH